METQTDPRVLFAGERTLLAWNRTSVAFMAFGFLIERSGILLNLLAPDKGATVSAYLTLLCGVAFILLGCFSALYSCIQYRRVLRSLDSSDVPLGYNIQWPVWMSFAVAFFGAVLVLCLCFHSLFFSF